MFTPAPAIPNLRTATPLRTPGWPLVVLALLACLLGAAGCERKQTYSQKTPDDVVASALSMVKNKDAKRLADLISSDGPEMRAVLNRLGGLFGKLQELAAQVQQRMPQEVAELKGQALDAAADSAPLGAFLQDVQRNPTWDEGDVRNEGRRDVIQSAFARLFADPYGWLDRNASRLSTVKMADDIAAVMIDDQPVMPPLGLTMRLEKDGKWYIVLPLNLPVVSNFMPRTREEWSIIASVIKIFENVAVELTDDVRTGKITRLKSLGDKAGDKALMPGLIAFAAYGKEMDARDRRDKITKAIKDRQKEWVKERGGPKSVSALLLKAFDAMTPAKAAKLARKPDRVRVTPMTDSEFTQFLQGWATESGLKLDLAFGVAGDDVDREAKRWLDEIEAKKAAEAEARKKAREKRK